MIDLHEESRERLQHIEKAIDDIEKYVTGESVTSFCDKDMLHDAVLLQFAIIGEAIIHLEYSILEKYTYP